MDVTLLTIFFKYCTIINFVFLIIVSIITRTDLAYNIHTKLGFWEGSKEAHKQLVYSLLGNYKILIIVLNVVPYLSLCCFM